MVMTSAGDLGILIDWGQRSDGDILQRKVGDEWQVYFEEAEHVTYPFDLCELPPGKYRLVPANRQRKNSE